MRKFSIYIALIASITLTMSATMVSCNKTSASNKNEQTVSTIEGSPVKHITADYMKKNIYDWEKNPNQFVFKGSRPAIIDFYADWCGPCRRLGPKLEDIAKKYEGKIDVYKVNVDDEPSLARLFGVQSIPMVLFVPIKGTPIQTLGDLSTDQIEETIAKIK